MDITERKRAEQILAALNNIAFTIQALMDPDEISQALVGEMSKLGFRCRFVWTSKEGPTPGVGEVAEAELESSEQQE
jgi:hypothetical protein